MSDYYTKVEMKTYFDAQKEQVKFYKILVASVSTLEKAYGNLSKAHFTLQVDFKAEKDMKKKNSKFMVNIWRGINNFQIGATEEKDTG